MTTDTHSTAEDIRKDKSGLVVEMNEKSYEKALIEIFSKYDYFAKNALLLSRKHEGIHWEMLQRIME